MNRRRMIDGDIIIGIGVILSAIFVYIGSKRNEADSKAYYQSRIDTLEASLALKNEELKLKQDKLNHKQDELKTSQDETQILAAKVLQFTEDINQITKATNSTSVKINNQLREKGSFSIKLPDRDKYTFIFGSNTTVVPKKDLLRGLSLNQPWGVPIYLILKSDELEISTIIRDSNGNILVDLRDSKWALDKSKVFSMNFDVNGLEVINSRGVVVFQLSIVDDKVNIQAVFFKEDALMIMADTGTFQHSYTNPKGVEGGMRWAYQNIKPIFVHGGEDYIGKRKDL